MTTTFHRGLETYHKFGSQGVVATLGTFDGMHRGHQAILSRVKEVGAASRLHSVLITFDPHPRTVVSPATAPLLLTTVEEKVRFIPCFFDGQVVILPFDKAMMNLAAEEFVKKVLVDGIGVKKLIVGYDHAFGRNRSGNIVELQRLAGVHGFELEVVEPVLFEGKPVSSSRIRETFKHGDYAEGTRLLGHDYAIFGTVERGIGLGRKLGYPTANVKYGPTKLLPPEGVYACWVQLGDEEFDGMMFVGTNHFNPAARVTVEANIFDFDRDIYDQEIVVYPTVFIRENRRFSGTDALVAQIAQDKNEILSKIRTGERKCQ